MAPHTATVEFLVDKGGFEPQEALAIAEGVDMAIVQSQLVTVPILDARLADIRADMRVESARLEGRLNERFFSLKADLEAKIERTRADLVKWVFLVMLGNVALSAGATAILNAVQHAH